MNKSQLIEAIAAGSGLSKKDCEKAVNAALDTITDKTRLMVFQGMDNELRISGAHFFGRKSYNLPNKPLA